MRTSPKLNDQLARWMSVTSRDDVFRPDLVVEVMVAERSRTDAENRIIREHRSSRQDGVRRFVSSRLYSPVLAL